MKVIFTNSYNLYHITQIIKVCIQTAGTHQNLKIFGSARHRLPIKFQKLYRWVPGSSKKIFLVTDGYWLPTEFSKIPTPACINNKVYYIKLI